MPCRRQVTIRLWMMPTCLAPSSVQQKSQDLRLWKCFSKRKGWLFSDTVRGALASAHLYSLVETAKANGIEPHAYLSRLFDRLPFATTVEDFEALLPWNAKAALPDSHLHALGHRKHAVI